MSKELIYTALSKHFFYFRAHISKFVLEQGHIPLNPFMLFDYFLLDSVPRDQIREANNGIVARADEIWVFGPISNGVLAEIQLAYKMQKPVRYFQIQNSNGFCPIKIQEIEFEDNLYSPTFKDEFLVKLKELDALGLPKDEFAISGSGPLAIRGIRRAQDIDLLVTKRLWEDLLKTYPLYNEKYIKIGDIEIGHDFEALLDRLADIMKTAEKKEGYPFLSLEDTIFWKRAMNREKDLFDIALIQEYLKKQAL